MTRLVANVVVTDPVGRVVTLAAGEELPGWAAGLVTNPKALAPDVPDPGEGASPAGSGELVTPAAEPVTAATEATPAGEPGEPAGEDVPVVTGDVPAPATETSAGDGTPAEDTPARDAADVPDYESMTVIALRALIRERNAGRDAAAQIPAEGSKADLITALETDDAGA